MPSLLGGKADNFCVEAGKLCNKASPFFESLAEQFKEDTSAATMRKWGAGVASGTLETFTPTLQMARSWVNFATSIASIVAITTVLVGADATSHFKKLGAEMNASLKGMCDAAEVSTNLEHESTFPQWVYDFVLDQVAKAAAPSGGLRELADVNDRHLRSCAESSRKDGPIKMVDQEKHHEQQAPAQYFFVYHPGNDWHGSFNATVRKKPIPGFIGATNNLNALGLYLAKFRDFIGPEAIINILLPSAHMYVIQDEILVSENMQPMRIMGQTHRSGNSYVHATITGVAATDTQDVGLLFKPNDISAATIAGAVAGGIGAGSAVAAVGFLAVATLGFTVAGPALVASAAVDSLVFGGAVVGGLASGSAVGAVTGRHVTERAKWKGTGRDEAAKEKAKKKNVVL